MALYSSYWHTSVGWNAANTHLCQQLVEHITRHRWPVVIGGGFNMEREELERGLQPAALNLACVQEPGEPTCKTRKDKVGRAIDFFMVSDKLVRCGMEAEVVKNTIYRPHKPVACRLRLPGQTIKVLTFEPYRQLGVGRPTGPRRPAPDYSGLAAKLDGALQQRGAMDAAGQGSQGGGEAARRGVRGVGPAGLA